MLLILASIFLLFLLNLLLGSVHIPFGKIWELLWGTGAASNPDTMSNQEVIWSNILWKSRVPQALTALVAGAGLSVSGLQMQTVFRNPLADLRCWASVRERAWEWLVWYCCPVLWAVWH